jgi:hypothetical protein
MFWGTLEIVKTALHKSHIPLCPGCMVQWYRLRLPWRRLALGREIESQKDIGWYFLITQTVKNVPIWSPWHLGIRKNLNLIFILGIKFD